MSARPTGARTRSLRRPRRPARRSDGSGCGVQGSGLELGRHGRDVEQDAREVDARDAVDQRVVGLRDEREAVVLEARGRATSPRAASSGRAAARRSARRGCAAAPRSPGLRQRGDARVVLEVEARVVDPQRPARLEAAGRRASGGSAAPGAGATRSARATPRNRAAGPRRSARAPTCMCDAWCSCARNDASTAVSRSLWPGGHGRNLPSATMRPLLAVLVGAGRARDAPRRARRHRRRCRSASDDSEPKPAAERRRGRTASTARAAFRLLRSRWTLGPRPAGSAASRALAARLRAAAAGRPLPGGAGRPAQRRRHGAAAATRARYVVVGAHYDTKDIPGFVGANDGAGGTAAVVQLARTLKPRTVGPTVVFILFDGEETPARRRPTASSRERGLRGSKVAARALQRRRGHDPARLRGGQGPVAAARGQLRHRAVGARCARRPSARASGAYFPDDVEAAISTTTSRSCERASPSIDLIDFDFACWHETLRRPVGRLGARASTRAARRWRDCSVHSD